MTVSWLVLKNTHGAYAPVLAAADTATQAKYSGTSVQSTRVTSFDATLTIVGVNLTDAERVGDLAPIARALEGTGVFIQEFVSQPHKDAIIFDFLGESGRTAYFIVNNWAQASQGALPTAVSTGTGGRTLADAVACEDYDAIAAKVTDPITVWILDDQLAVADTGFGNQNLLATGEDGTSAALPNIYRFDYPGRHGCWWGGTLLGNVVTWSDDGETPAAGTGHIWSMTVPAGMRSFPNGMILDPGFDGNGNATPGEFGRQFLFMQTEAAMEAAEYSSWNSNTGVIDAGHTFKCHLPLGEDPTNRVAWLTKENALMKAKQMSFPRTGVARTFIEFREYKARNINLRLNIDNAQFLRGLNGAPGYDSDLDGNDFTTNSNFVIQVDTTADWGTGQTFTGPFIQGLRMRRSGWAFRITTANPTGVGNIMTGTVLEDVDAADIGGHNPNYDNSDGHAVGCQGVPPDLTIQGTFRAVRCGGPVNIYVTTDNDTDPALINNPGMAFVMNCTEVDIRDHAEFSTVSGVNNDAGIHLTGDADPVGDFSGSSITLSGTISGFRYSIRNKWATQVPVTSHTNGGLIIEKGAYGGSDSVGMSSRINTNITEIVLSSSAGNWAIGDKLEDPDTPGACIAIISRVVGSNPTVELQIKYVDVNTFADTDAVANLDDTGTGTVNGAPTLLGNVAGNLKYSNIDFAADIDEWWNGEANEAPDGLAADVNAVGFHVDADDNIYRGSTTGKFTSGTHGVQNFTAWKANSAGDNVYDPNSTNPGS